MTPKPRYIPTGALKVADKHSDAVAYLTERANKATGKTAFLMLVYFGKQSKPYAHYRYSTQAAREEAVMLAFRARRAQLQELQERKQNRSADCMLAKGDILSTCWGYDQTNREFYEVLEVKGRHVIIQELEQITEATGSMTGRCRPVPGSYVGKPMRKLVQWGDKVKIDHHHASKWNTSNIAGVPIGPTLSYSSYH